MESNGKLHSVGLLYYANIPQAQRWVAEIKSFMAARGLSTWLGVVSEGGESDCPAADLDMLIVLGGDRTVLHAAQMTLHSGTPILGINLGHVGFLTEMSPDDWQAQLSRVLSGEHRIEERSMLRTELSRDGELVAAGEILNEALISRGLRTRLMRLVVHINDEYLTTYPGDGVIVSTPTGSTAYAWDMGGPILSPQLKGILLVPISAHLHLNRPIVFEQEARIHIQIFTAHRGMLAIDGHTEVVVQDGDCVTIQASPHVTRFVRLQNSVQHFHKFKAIPVLN
jgi:NAD+ kinase